MVMPTLHAFNKLGEMLVHKYERYLPTAFDESLSLLEKVNKIINYLNETGELVNGVVDEWSKVMDWVLKDGLSESVINRLNEMAIDGSLHTIINEEILGSKASIVISTDEPTTFDTQTFWYQQISIVEFPQNNTGNIVVQDDEPTNKDKIWYDIE